MLHVFLLVDKKLDLGAPKVSNMEARGVQNRGLGHQQRGLKTWWFSAPEKVTKMTSKCLPFGDPGPTMDGPGGGLGALGGAQTGPMCHFNKF